jgi:hypothetical protein
MSLVSQIYVVAFGRNSREPKDISVGILTKRYNCIDDVFKESSEAEVTAYGDYPRPSHHEKGFYYAVKKELVIALTDDVAVLDSIMAKISLHNAQLCELRSTLLREIISSVK